MTAENHDVQPMMADDLFPARPGTGTGAIEAWLRHELSARYDRTLDENVPAEMLALLSALH